MTDGLEPLLFGSAAWLATYLIHSTVLIVGASVVTRAVRLGPETRGFLWRLALLGGVVTSAAIAGPAGTAEEVRLVRRIVVVPAPPPARGIDGAWTEPYAVAPASSVGCREVRREGPSGDSGWALRVECADAAGPPWVVGLLLAFWLAGASLSLARIVGGLRDARRMRDFLEPAGPRPRRLLAELDPPPGVTLVSSAAAASPCVLPGRAVVLPRRCDDLSDAELRAVLAHELAHVRREDVGWSALLHIVSSLLWVQPLNRLALRRAMEAAEEACDDWAVARTGEPKALAVSLGRFAAWAVAVPGTAGPVSITGRGPGAVSSRIRRILVASRGHESVWMRATLALLVLGPLPLLPRLPMPTVLRSTVHIEAREVDSTSPRSDLGEPGAPGTEGVAARIFVVQVESD